MQKRYFAAYDIIMIHHITEGSNTSRDTVFLHGFGGSVSSFEHIARAMRGYDGHRTTLLDFYGFGKTPPKDKPMTLDDYTESVVELVNFYGMKDVTLVAHSFGGRVAVRLAAERPEVKRLLLADSAGLIPKRGLKYYAKVYSYKLMKGFGVELKTGSPDYNSMSGVMRKTFVNIVNTDIKPYLSLIACPTILVWGEIDTETPVYMAEIFRKRIKNSHLIIFENCGHFAYLENSARFIGILKAFTRE